MSSGFLVNGVSSAVDADLPVTTNSGIRNLIQKISVLEQEKQELMYAKQSATQKIEELKREIFRSKSDKQTLDSIAARAAELETEVSRLQHDLISSATEGQEANAELSELKQVAERLKKSKSEKTNKITVIENETNLLLERLNKDTERLKAGENRIRVLEKKIYGFPARNIGQKTEKKLKVEDSEKDDLIRSLKRIIDEFQSVVAKNRTETKRLKKEKDELEIEKNDLEALLKKSERRVKEMEQKINGLHKELEAYQNINILLKEKMVERMNGGMVNRGGVLHDEEKSLMCLKLDWPVVAVTAGVIATVAVVYLRYAKI